MNNLLRFSDIEKPNYFPQGKQFRISFDPNLNMMRICCKHQNVFNYMREAFSAENETAFYVSMHGYQVETKVYLINPFGLFKPGLFFEIISYIKRQYGTLSTVEMSQQCKDYVSEYLTPLKKYVKNYSPDTFNIRNIREDSGTNTRLPEDERMSLRDYQEEAIRRMIFNGYGRGLLELPTSAGKSFVIANYIYNMEKQILKGLKYLIFVPNVQLVSQFYKDLIDYGFPEKYIKILSEKKHKNKDEARIIIAHRQYVFKNRDAIPQVDVLINDEVHQGKSKSATIEIVDNIDCKIKFGFSGTLPRAKYEKLSLEGSFGRILFVEEITHLQEQGYISKLKINLIKIHDKIVQKDRNYLFHEDSVRKFSLKHPNGIKFNDAYDAEIKYINDNYQRLYSPIIEELSRMEGNTLILFDRIEFGVNMFELARSSAWNKKVFYIDGQTPVTEREQSRAEMEKSDNNIIFGQCSILSTGINIKNLTNLVMMVSTKSFSRILQSIGRTLRLHKNKDYANLYDISFNYKYSQKHLGERLAIYKDMYNKTADETKVIEV